MTPTKAKLNCATYCWVWTLAETLFLVVECIHVFSLKCVVTFHVQIHFNLFAFVLHLDASMSLNLIDTFHVSDSIYS